MCPGSGCIACRMRSGASSGCSSSIIASSHARPRKSSSSSQEGAMATIIRPFKANPMAALHARNVLADVDILSVKEGLDEQHPELESPYRALYSRVHRVALERRGDRTIR